MRTIQSGRTYRAFITTLMAGVILSTLCLTNAGTAQGVRQSSGQPGTIGAGTTIKVRTNKAIKTSDSNGQVFSAVVDQDVMGKNGKVVIPKGSNAELMVKRISSDNVALDLDSVTVNGQRYGVQTENKVVGAQEKEGIGANKRTG